MAQRDFGIVFFLSFAYDFWIVWGYSFYRITVEITKGTVDLKETEIVNIGWKLKTIIVIKIEPILW